MKDSRTAQAPARGHHLLTIDEQCPTCLHPAWTHLRVVDKNKAGVGPRCIGQDCKCRALAR